MHRSERWACRRAAPDCRGFRRRDHRRRGVNSDGSGTDGVSQRRLRAAVHRSTVMEGAPAGGEEPGRRSADNPDWHRDEGRRRRPAHRIRRTRAAGGFRAFPMNRSLSRSNARRFVVMLSVIGGLMLFYEATTFDLLPWGGMPGAANPSAPVPGSRLDFSATAYCKGKTTASGAEVRTGIAAADDAILPVGSVVNVSTDNVRYNGVYTIMDTGPRVQGRVLDLYMWSCNEALAFGRKPIQVTVLRLGWNPQASTPSF